MGVPAHHAKLALASSGPLAPLTLVACALLSTACGSSETQTVSAPSAVRCGVRIEAETATFPPSGGTGALRVSTSRECQWNARAEAAWVTLSAGDGQGDGSLQYTVASNADPDSRSTSIVINEERVQVAQQGKPCEFTLSSNRESVDGSGGERTIQVRAGSARCAWTASANVPWITVAAGRDGRGDGAVRFTVDPLTGPPRTGTLTIAGHVVNVDQGGGCSYTLSADTFAVDPSGGDRQVAVSAGSGCAWTAESAAAWITITSGSTGTGPGVVGFRVAAHDGPPRTGTLRVAGRTVTVQQMVGCSVAVTPPNVSAGAGGGSATLQIETASGCGWSAVSDAGWISLPGPANGSGRGQVQVAVAANVGPARTGSVTVAGHKIPVAQASGCTYSVSPAMQQVSPGGGSASASVSTAAGCTWTATSGVDWISMTTRTGSGAGPVTFTVAPNLSPARAATLTIAGQTHGVAQPSQCTWSFIPPSHEMPSTGGFGTVLVFVTGPCTWTATSTADWIGIVTGSGTGGGLVQFTVAANRGPARSGVVVIGAEKYQVVQHAGQ